MKLVCQKVTKHFQNRTVLQSVSFQAETGEALLFQGENGVGKTTLLKILARLLMPDEGEITFQTKPKSALARFLAYCPDVGFGFAPLTVEEHIYFFTSLFLSTRDIAALVDRYQLQPYLQTPFAHLSAGYRKRLSLLLTFAKKAEVILLDEPFSHLDETAIATTKSALQEYLPHTLLILTSPASLQLSFPTRRYTIQQGKLLL